MRNSLLLTPLGIAGRCYTDRTLRSLYGIIAMTAFTFDTLKLVDTLEKVDIPREQARAIVQVVRESHDATDVATKGDLALLQAKLEAKIAIARRDTIIWLGAISITGFVTLAGLVLN